MRKALAVAATLAILSSSGHGHFSARAESPLLWWEAETTQRDTFPERTAFSINTPGDWSVLSGGDWLTHDGKAGAELPTATYQLDIPEAGTYQFWARKFWKHGPFRWRFRGGPWQTVTRDAALVDRRSIRKHVEASWVYAGEVELPAGPARFEIQLAAKPGEVAVAGLDCFVLSGEPFRPRGAMRPGEQLTDASPGWFAFDPPHDTFTDDALLDLRHLNEPVAGVHGPLRRSPDGNDIHLGDGTPVRFWGVNVSHNLAGQPDAQVDHAARRLAKLGVNMVRYHGGVWREDGTYRLDPQRQARIQNLVAALKAQGIYTNVSWYFPMWIQDASQIGLAGYAERPADARKPFAALFFNDKMQTHYLDLMRSFFGTPHAETGVSLAQEPAVGIIELCNEDSLFFWTFNRKSVPAEQWDILETKFATYLRDKHGSLAAAFKRWPKARHERDNKTTGRAGVYEAWHMTRDAVKAMSKDQRKRMAEQVEFLASLQKNFYRKAAAVLRDELGYQGLISAGNWHTADPTLTDAIERWTYTAGDVMDRHGYFGGKHQGDGASYSVRVGHEYKSRSALLHPDEPPLRTNQVVGHPQIISELGWTNPNRFRADATLLTATTAWQQGVDGVFFFIWDSATGVDSALKKFPASTPLIAGSFPANALLFRQGHLPEAPVAVHESLQTRKLFNLHGTAAVTDAAYDAFRQSDVPHSSKPINAEQPFDPLSAYVGKVTRQYDRPGNSATHTKLPKAINRQHQRLESLAGGFEWDYRHGVATVNTAFTQSAAGFLTRVPPVQLDAITIESRNEYSQIAVTSLDGQPIQQSKRILIQAVTEEQLFGYGVEHGTVTALGKSPWNLKRIDATVTVQLQGEPVQRVVALDGNGQAVAEPSVLFTGDGVNEPLVLTLPADRLYTVIER